MQVAAVEVLTRAVGAADKSTCITASEDALGVDLVTNKMQRVFPRKLRRELNLFREEDAAGGVVWAADEQRAQRFASGAGLCRGGRQRFRREDERGGRALGGDDGNGGADASVHVKAKVVGCRYNDAVAGVADGKDEVVEHLCCGERREDARQTEEGALDRRRR